MEIIIDKWNLIDTPDTFYNLFIRKHPNLLLSLSFFNHTWQGQKHVWFGMFDTISLI